MKGIRVCDNVAKNAWLIYMPPVTRDGSMRVSQRLTLYHWNAEVFVEATCLYSYSMHLPLWLPWPARRLLSSVQEQQTVWTCGWFTTRPHHILRATTGSLHFNENISVFYLFRIECQDNCINQIQLRIRLDAWALYYLY